MAVPMAKKRLSGGTRARFARARKAVALAPAKRGPKGRTKRRQVQEDFELIVRQAASNKKQSDGQIAQILRWPDSLRAKKLFLGPCSYRDMNDDALRRLIRDIRNRYYEQEVPVRVAKIGEDQEAKFYPGQTNSG
jgi:hypothetical protein